MQLHLLRVDGEGVSYATTPTERGTRVDWSVTNIGDEPKPIRSVRLVFAMHGFRGAPRMFRHGYQSWSWSDVATFGVDVDPSSMARNEFFQACHHADQRTVGNEHELRSEWVTIIGDDGPDRLLVGFVGSGVHDGTLRLTHGVVGDTELHVEAFLGDAEIGAGATFALDPVMIELGADATTLLDAWAERVGRAADARVNAPYQVGWCSWYHYFDNITEDALRANLALAAQFPFEVFQLDDGYQAHIGDWLNVNEKFPSGLPAIATAIRDAGYRPGIWIAPFLVAPDATIALEHPEWLAQYRSPSGNVHPLMAWWNPGWGGGRDGYMYALDTSNPEVLEHLAHVASELVAMGFTYIKLDFTFAPSADALWHDRSKTPAQRVRAGFDAIRRGAGDDAFLLGCGVPLAHVVGVLDGNRIGPDVAPLWSIDPSTEAVAGYLRTQPSTEFARDATVARSFMHRRFWLNDPDCLMLRATNTALSPDDARRWANTVGLSGGMALVSDDLALLDDEAAALLRDTIELGRTSDAAALSGAGPLRPELF